MVKDACVVCNAILVSAKRGRAWRNVSRWNHVKEILVSDKCYGTLDVSLVRVLHWKTITHALTLSRMNNREVE